MFELMKYTYNYFIILFILVLFSAFIFHGWQWQNTDKIARKIPPLDWQLPSIELVHQEQQNIRRKTKLFNQKLATIIKKSTVRIFANNPDFNIGGTGVLIKGKNKTYFIITNDHVVNDNRLNYNIVTPQGKTYKAEIIKKNDNNTLEKDLALLKFQAEEEYQTIKISRQNLYNNQQIIASGFAFQDNLKQSSHLNYSKGHLVMILDKPLKGGYQLGYTNLVKNGMSGGPIVNKTGELIGLNGLGKYPIFGNPYIYNDGTVIDEKMVKKMSELSWGIPVKYIEKFLKKYSRNSI